MNEPNALPAMLPVGTAVVAEVELRSADAARPALSALLVRMRFARLPGGES